MLCLTVAGRIIVLHHHQHSGVKLNCVQYLNEYDDNIMWLRTHLLWPQTNYVHNKEWLREINFIFIEPLLP